MRKAKSASYLALFHFREEHRQPIHQCVFYIGLVPVCEELGNSLEETFE